MTWVCLCILGKLRPNPVSFQGRVLPALFLDDAARLINDPNNSEDEDRFILLGYSKKSRMLLACHCHRDAAESIRIISARKAEKQEKRQYEGFKLWEKVMIFQIQSQIPMLRD